MRIGRIAFKNRLGMTTQVRTPPVDEAVYDRFYPYYAEICTLTEIQKKPGFGVPLNSGMGGHCLLYLNGVRRDPSAGYPTLKLCAPDESPATHAVCISVNAHYKNANWVAAEGRDFIFRGALELGEPITPATYERTQKQAQEMGLLDGVEFHDHLFRDKPAGMTVRDYMYEISAATDYGLRFGRDSYRARIPLDPPRMAAIVDYLNQLNTPFRDGARIFLWRVMTDNCVHVVHNALAAAGVWAPWPTGQFIGRAAFNFPVPKNEFVDLMLRTNDLPVEDANAMYQDKFARQALLATGTLPGAPGALAIAEPAIQDNEMYNIDRLRLIFFDHPFFGSYKPRFARIFREPRYFDLETNLHHFAEIYQKTPQQNRTAQGENAAARTQFQMRYDTYITRQAATVSRQLATLAQPAEQMAEAEA